MKIINVLFFIISLNAMIAVESDYTIGLFGSYNWYAHQVSFQQIEEYSNCCPKFDEGYGFGYGAGILLEHKLNSFLYLNSMMQYQNIESSLISLEGTQLIQNNKIIAGEFEHTIKTYMTFINMSVGMGFYLTNYLAIETGVYFNKNLVGDFIQFEKISKPLNSATFVDSDGFDTQRRIRNEYSGKLTNLSDLIYGISASINYSFPLNKRKNIKITPEIGMNFDINNLSDKLNWKTNSVQFNLSLKYTPYYLNIKYKTIEKFDTLTIITKNVDKNIFVFGVTKFPTEVELTDDNEIHKQFYLRTDTLFIPKAIELVASLDVVGVDSNNLEIKHPKFLIEQFVSNRHQPLLNYIFFDSSSSSIPERYIKLEDEESDRFTTQSLSNKSTLETYYHVLNIIGKRMSEKPISNIKLVGCNSNMGYENGNLKLSQKRALEVKNYLTKIWDINPQRISIESKNLPTSFSYPTSDYEKAQENRRVEIYSNDDDILKPVFISDTILKINPATIRFYTSSKSDLPIKNWTLMLKNGNINQSIVKQEVGNSSLPKFINVKLKDNKDFTSNNIDSLNYYLIIQDERKNKFETKHDPIKFETITIEKKRQNQNSDIEINKFNLMLFDFTSSKIAGNNSKIIDLVKSKLENESKVKIIGYTDRTGDSENNRKLSMQRAQSTNKLIDVSNSIVEGLGEDTLLYDNDLPEGRFYSRTVEIIIETPIENK